MVNKKSLASGSEQGDTPALTALPVGTRLMFRPPEATFDDLGALRGACGPHTFFSLAFLLWFIVEGPKSKQEGAAHILYNLQHIQTYVLHSKRCKRDLVFTGTWYFSTPVVISLIDEL